MKNSISIRKVIADEALLLSELAAFTFYEAWIEPGNEADLNLYMQENFSLSVIHSELSNPDICYLIIKVDDISVGYLKLEFNCQPEGYELVKPVALHRLYVKASHRNLKLGSQLMDAAINEGCAKGAKTIWLGVWNENHAAMRFYERFGFERFGNYQFVMGTIISDDYLMKRNL